MDQQQTASVSGAQPVKLPGPITLFKRAWTFYKANFRKMWPLYILGGLGGIGFQTNFGGEYTSKLPPFAIILIITLSIALSIVFLLAKISLLKGISDAKKGQYVDLKTAFSRGSHLFWSFFWLSIVIGMSTFGASVLLIVPGIILGVYVCLATYELADRDRRGISAMLGSWALVKNYWLAVFLRFIGIGIIIVIVSIIVFCALFILALLPVLIAIALKSNVLLAIMGAVGLVGFAILALMVIEPVAIIAGFELYYSLRDARANETLSTSEIDSSRRKKIVGASIIGVVAILLMITAAIIFAPQIERMSEVQNIQQNRGI